jgi:hypothetical protein
LKLGCRNSHLIQNRESVAISGKYGFVDNPHGSNILWKLDLIKTKEHWKGWYVGMNQKLLGASLARVPKVCVCIGREG